MATKQDLKQLELQMRGMELNSEVTQLEYRLVFKLSTIVGAMITLAIAVTTAVAKFL